MRVPERVERMCKFLAHTTRSVGRTPAFFVVAISLIALGISAATTIFALVNALLLRPLPVRDPENLVQAFQIFGSSLRPQGSFAYPFYERLANEASTLFDVFGHSETPVTLDAGGGPERTYVQTVTDNFFTALGVEPALGTLVTSGDARLAVLSYDGWTRYFSRDPNALGRRVRIGQYDFQIIGVTREGFNGTNADVSPAVRVSHRFITELAGPDADWLQIIARLKPGVPLSAAQEQVRALWKNFTESTQSAFGNSYLELRSIKYGVSYLRDQFRTALIILMAGTGLLLLIVCANVGGLFLVRNAARAKETALRLALGATRWRIITQSLTESFLVAIAGTDRYRCSCRGAALAEAMDA